jgi:hypothetical protein
VVALLERLVPLWTQPGDARDAPEAAFAEVYADPVVVNGTEMTITELTGRARSLQRAFDRLGMHILDTVETPDRIVIAFLMRGRHVGPFISPLGTVAPTQRDIEVRTIGAWTWIQQRRTVPCPARTAVTGFARVAADPPRPGAMANAIDLTCLG